MSFFSQENLGEVAEGLVYEFTPLFWKKYATMIYGSILIYIASAFAQIGFLKVDTLKKKAYMLSITSSSITSFLSMPIAFSCLLSYVQGSTAFETWFMTNTSYTEFIMVFYLVFLHLDLIFGSLFYSAHLDMLTAYVHHISYILLVNTALYNNFSNGLSSFFIEELPTAILALGTVVPTMRNDAAFGLTFICTRIVYHSIITLFVSTEITHRTSTWILTIITLIVHVLWFHAWLQKYGKFLRHADSFINQRSKDMGEGHSLVEKQSYSRGGRAGDYEAGTGWKDLSDDEVPL